MAASLGSKRVQAQIAEIASLPKLLKKKKSLHFAAKVKTKNQ